MKNTIQLNIGTATLDGQTLTIPEISTALRRHGLVLTASRIVTGQWEGKEETTLAVECLPALPICHAECRLAIVSAIGKLARELRQTCIAIAWPDGSGELCPPVSGQSFDPLFFHPADRVTYAEAAGACDADKEQLIAYLEGTLIPDLEASGYGATVEDFKICIRFMSHPSPARPSDITSGW